MAKTLSLYTRKSSTYNPPVSIYGETLAQSPIKIIGPKPEYLNPKKRFRTKVHRTKAQTYTYLTFIFLFLFLHFVSLSAVSISNRLYTLSRHFNQLMYTHIFYFLWLKFSNLNPPPHQTYNTNS